MIEEDGDDGSRRFFQTAWLQGALITELMTEEQQPPSPDPITLRPATVADGSELWRLVRDSEALEGNSCYLYVLLCEHFGDTCLVAQWGEEVVGFVTAYVPPRRPDVIFVWQIGVDRRARKRGLAKRLLKQLLAQPACRSVRFLEATVAPSNAASRRLFQSLAEELGVPCETMPGFRATDFRYETHEEEDLFRIGPMEQDHECKYQRENPSQQPAPHENV